VLRAQARSVQKRSSSREQYGRACRRPTSVSGVVLLCLALASSLLWQGGCRTSRTVVPSDQELISTFHAHRQAFEQVQEMSAADARRGWYLGASDPGKLDQSRRDGYKKLISEIRPDLQVAMNGTTGVVRFVFAGEGSAIGSDWFKGIEYVPGDYTREGVLLPDLDRATSLPDSLYIREVEPRWVIFYQRDK
jgi:hypothetical protein